CGPAPRLLRVRPARLAESAAPRPGSGGWIWCGSWQGTGRRGRKPATVAGNLSSSPEALVISAGHETPSVNHDPRGLSINFIEILSGFPFVSRMRKRVETELPALHSQRWTIRRKAAVLEALHSGALTLDRALCLICRGNSCLGTATRTARPLWLESDARADLP